MGNGKFASTIREGRSGGRQFEVGRAVLVEPVPINATRASITAEGHEPFELPLTLTPNGELLLHIAIVRGTPR